ncbi:hypothetical protein ACWDYK_01365 [Streptomyces anthocyanicus]
MLFTHTSTPSTSPDLPGHDRTGGLPHDREKALVVRRKHGLLHVLRAVWDHHHCLATHLPRRRRERGPLLGGLLTHPLQDLLSDGQFVALGPYLRQLLGQLLFEFVQFRTPRGDPFQQLGIHTPDRRRPLARREWESGKPPRDGRSTARTTAHDQYERPGTRHTSAADLGFSGWRRFS